MRKRLLFTLTITVRTLFSVILLTNTVAAAVNAYGTGDIIIVNSESSTRVVSSAMGIGSEDGYSTLICDKATALGLNTINCFSHWNIQLIQAQPDNNGLALFIGVDSEATQSNLQSMQSYQSLFTNDNHLFDIDRFRTAAQNLNLRTVGGILPQQYGELSFAEFINNVTNAIPMYGLVRVLVPLQSGPGGTNAHGQHSNKIYRFCTGNAGLCNCAPIDIIPGANICGNVINTSSAIVVKGALFLDFVDNLSSAPIPLSQLPAAPRDLYFKVQVPINVNPANDLNSDNIMDNIDQIADHSRTQSCFPLFAPCSIPLNPVIAFTDIPAHAKLNYKNKTGIDFTETVFNTLSIIGKYQMLFSSGYANGWREAFEVLGITATEWRNYGFKAPDPLDGSELLKEPDIWSVQFEDIPAYMYTGGLIDMHYHVNISGLLYVPQGLELEQKDPPIGGAPFPRQYFFGGMVLRDAFYIEANQTSGSVTLIASDPDSFSRIKLVPSTTSTTNNVSFHSGHSVKHHTGTSTSQACELDNSCGTGGGGMGSGMGGGMGGGMGMGMGNGMGSGISANTNGARYIQIYPRFGEKININKVQLKGQ